MKEADMADTNAANADEGASPEKDVENSKNMKTHGGAEAHMSPTYDLDVDVPPARAEGGSEDDGRDEADQLERTREHADPSKGDKPADEGERVSTDDEEELDNPAN